MAFLPWLARNLWACGFVTLVLLAYSEPLRGVILDGFAAVGPVQQLARYVLARLCCFVGTPALQLELVAQHGLSTAAAITAVGEVVGFALQGSLVLCGPTAPRPALSQRYMYRAPHGLL